MADSFDFLVDVSVDLIDLYQVLAPVGGLLQPGSGLPITVVGNDCAVWVGLSDAALEDYILDNNPKIMSAFEGKPQALITTERTADVGSITLAGNCCHILFQKWPKGVLYLRNQASDVNIYRDAIQEWKLVSSSRLQ